MDVKIRCNSRLELLERAYRLWEFTCEWLQNSKHPEYQPLFTTQAEWTIVKYIMEVLNPFRYWTGWMLTRHTVTLHYVIIVYNDMFDHIDGIMRAWPKKKTQRNEDLFFAVKFTRQKLFEDYPDVTSTTGMRLISTHILDHFRKLPSFTKWDEVMYITPEEETFYTNQYQEAFLK